MGFGVEVIDGLDLSAMVKSYRGSGRPAIIQRYCWACWFTATRWGSFSSRKLERATYDSVAFRFIAANDHSYHDTIATFRRRFLKDIEGLFVRVLELAGEIGVLKLGTVGLDGTKIHANASRHSALSYEHAGKIEVSCARKMDHCSKNSSATNGLSQSSHRPLGKPWGGPRKIKKAQPVQNDKKEGLASRSAFSRHSTYSA
jgi:transposase